MPAPLLLNPGPVTLSARVRAALTGPDLCHREPEFSALQSGIRQSLLKVYGLDAADHAAVLLTGSGTSAMEAMVSSLVPPTGRLLVIENGVYGERLSRIAAVHGIDHLRLEHAWGAPIDLGRLAQVLDAQPGLTHVALVQHETTTGRLNAVEPVARLCRERGIALLLDAVSSFGAEEIDFDGWNIAACAATANKCLHGVPGAAFVIARRDALASPALKPRTLYLDLPTYCREQDKGGTPFTQSVQCFHALAEALAEFHEQGGWPARRARFAALADQVGDGLAALGIKPLLPRADSSVVLRAYHLPGGTQGIGYPALHDALKAAGFVIYAGQGGLASSAFRISTMGELTAQDMQRLLDAMAALLGHQPPR